nr:VWA domain-containing protein [Myxococcota bacterium]
MNVRIPNRRRRAWGLAAAAVALAAGGIVLSSTPEPASAVPMITTTAGTSTAIAGGDASSRAELHGPGVDGFFAFTEGAVLAGGLREIYAELRLTGAAGGVERRAPVSLAVVLDHSGSMSGDKIIEAREAVVSLLARMHDDDRLAVVVYDHEAQVLQPLARVRELRATLPARIREITATGGTNIPAGMYLGATTLAAAPGDTVRRLVLISDGQDGSGETLASITGRVAERASERVTTSSLGIGVDYDERFLSSVADAGHGNYAFLAESAMLDPFLRVELEQAASTVAEDVIAEIDLPPGATLRNAHGAIASIDGSHLRLPLGSLFSGERRKVVLELAAPIGAPGTLATAAVQVRYSTIADGEAHAIDGGRAAVRAVATASEVDAARDAELHADALSTAIDAQQIAATTAWQAGRREEALQLTDAHLA